MPEGQQPRYLSRYPGGEKQFKVATLGLDNPCGAEVSIAQQPTPFDSKQTSAGFLSCTKCGQETTIVKIDTNTLEVEEAILKAAGNFVWDRCPLKQFKDAVVERTFISSEIFRRK